jgi:hypothetical protein
MATVQLTGGHLFSAFFPLYCQVASAGQYTINATSVDDYFLVSVNGGAWGDAGWQAKINLNAGINRVVFYYQNAAWSGAYLYFNLLPTTALWLGRVGQALRRLIPRSC